VTAQAPAQAIGHQLAIVMGGGAARGAYQVGVLRAIASRYPDLEVSILTGVSAGAINAVYLASQPGSFAQRVHGLAEMWSKLEVEDIFKADLFSLGKHGLRWVFQLGLLGGRMGVPNVRGLVDTSPLERLLRKTLRSSDGSLDGIQRNLAGHLKAVAVTATDYTTGETVTFCEGESIATWDRPKRRSVKTPLQVQHVMASAALPVFFPAVSLAGSWFGDGGVRLHSPLAPACHLGADRILAISTRHQTGNTRDESNVPRGYPPPAQILGVLYNAIFQDNLEQDAAHMGRVNGLVAAARGAATTHRELSFSVVRPSLDLGREARPFEPRLPRAFRFATRRLGTREQKSQDLSSMVMFQSDYLCRLMEIGEQDARAQQDELAALIEGK
jgi:NTE family protein